jgi:predicted thioesterase
VHAGFGAQEAVGIVALDLDAGAADAGHVAVGLFQQFGLEALALAVFQVLAQQHAGPVAGFGAAGAGLDVDEAVVGVGRVVEHAAEFEVGDQFLRLVEVAFDRRQGVLVVFVARQFEQVAGIGEACLTPDSVPTTASRDFFLAAQGLGALGIVPELRVFEDLVQFGKLFRFAVVVKDTSAVARHDRKGRRYGWRRR